MTDRIGDYAQHQRITSALLAAQSRTRETQAQISSGKAATAFVDIASEADRLLSVKSTLQEIRQFVDNNELVSSRLQTMDGAVGSMIEIGTRMRNLLVQRLSSGLSEPGRVTAEAELLLDQVVSELNTSMHGRYLFAGSRIDQPPAVLDPVFATPGAADATFYRGDQVTPAVRADQNVTVTYGMTAEREGFQQLVGALRTVVEADAVDDVPLLESALQLLSDALPKLSNYQADLGSNQARLEEINLLHGRADVYLQQQISQIEDVDLAEAVTRLTQDQILLESAMATIGRLSQLSLADFLK